IGLAPLASAQRLGAAGGGDQGDGVRGWDQERGRRLTNSSSTTIDNTPTGRGPWASRSIAVSTPWPLRLHNGQVLEALAEDGRAGAGEPLVEDGGVDAAEVDGVLRVAVHQVAQVRVGAVHPGAHARPDQEHRRGRAVVGPGAGVLVQ